MRSGHPVSGSGTRLLGPASLAGVLALGMLSIIPLIPADAQAGSAFTMTIVSSTTDSHQLTGYRVVLYDSSGNVAAAGFTTAQFSVVEGQNYSILADSYGNCQFYAWGGADHPAYFDNPHAFTATPSLDLEAIYMCGTPAGTSQLTITTQDVSGNAISGYYTVLNQSGSLVATSFTPARFNLDDGQTYTVQVDGYGDCHFDHWQDTGSTASYRTVSITGAASYVAVMNCGTAGGSATVTVNSVDQSGSPIYGYYIDLYAGGPSPAQSGFTTVMFNGLTAGDRYTIQAQNYGNCTFTRFVGEPNGSSLNFPASPGDNLFTAVYSCT